MIQAGKSRVRPPESPMPSPRSKVKLPTSEWPGWQEPGQSPRTASLKLGRKVEAPEDTYIDKKQ